MVAAVLIALGSPAVAAADIGSCDLRDATYSWWTHPIAHQDAAGVVHFGAVSADGTVTSRADCDATVLEHGNPDDHDAAAIVSHPTRARISFYPGHGDRAVVRFRHGMTDGAVTFPGAVAYAQALVAGDRIVLLTRVDHCAWYAATSPDWGVSWTDPIPVLDDCHEGGQVYLTTAPHQTTPGLYRMAVAGHPSTSSWRGIEYGLIDVGRGRITTPGVIQVGDLRTGAGLPLVRGSLASVYVPPMGRTLRLLDVGAVGGAPLVVFAEWADPTDARYVAVRFAAGRWAVERSLPATGRPFWAPSMYVGGASITGHGDIVLSRRSTSGVWRVEQHRRVTTGWTSLGSLVSSRTPLVRPYVVRGGSTVLIQRADDYRDYRHFRTAILELDLRPPARSRPLVSRGTVRP